jgi:hypothetical protein
LLNFLFAGCLKDILPRQIEAAPIIAHVGDAVLFKALANSRRNALIDAAAVGYRSLAA